MFTSFTYSRVYYFSLFLLVLEELVFQWRESFWELRGFSSWVTPGFSAVSLLPLRLRVVLLTLNHSQSRSWLGGIPGSCSDTAALGGGCGHFSICHWERQGVELICEGGGTSSAVLDPPAEELLQCQALKLRCWFWGHFPSSSHQLPGVTGAPGKLHMLGKFPAHSVVSMSKNTEMEVLYLAFLF